MLYKPSTIARAGVMLAGVMLAGVMLAGVMLIAGSLSIEASALPPPSSQTNRNAATADLPDEELQLWQGRIVKVRRGELLMKIEGEQEAFDVSPKADIRRNRRKCDLEDLAARDFATIATIGSDLGERVVKIRAFSAR